MTELDETTDPALDDELSDFLQRELRAEVISKALPYILITVDPETAQATVEEYGFQQEALPQVLTEMARILSEEDPIAS